MENVKNACISNKSSVMSKNACAVCSTCKIESLLHFAFLCRDRLFFFPNNSKNTCFSYYYFSPQYLRSNKHEDVLDELIEAGNKEVGPKGLAQCPKQGRILCFLWFSYNQDFRLLYSLALFALNASDLLGRVQSFLLCPGKRDWKERQTASDKKSQ